MDEEQQGQRGSSVGEGGFGVRVVGFDKCFEESKTRLVAQEVLWNRGVMGPTFVWNSRLRRGDIGAGLASRAVLPAERPIDNRSLV